MGTRHLSDLQPVDRFVTVGGAKALQSPDVQARLKNEGAEVFATPPDEAAAAIRKELDK